MYLRKKSLTRKERLCKRSDLKHHFKNAKKIRYKGVTLLYLETGCTYNRIAIIARKGFKNAVIRNRQKRLAKEAYRNLKADMKSGYDLIIFVVPENYSYKEYVLIIKFLFFKAHIIR